MTQELASAETGRTGEAAGDIDALLNASRRASAPQGGSILARLGDLAGTAAEIVDAPLSGRSARRWWIVREQNGELTLQRIDRGRSGPAVPLDPASQPRARRANIRASDTVELRLDADQIITQRLALPGESRGFVEAVIDHRLDRLTPWKPEDVVYGFAVAEETKGSISVEIAATSKLIARNALIRLRDRGIRATALGSAAEPVDRPVAIDLLRGHGDRRHAARRRRLRAICLLVAPTLLAVFLASVWLRLDAQSKLDLATGQLAAERRAVQALGTAGGADDRVLALIGAKRLDEARFHLIDRLAAIVPADTFLSDLEVTSDTLRLKGSSADAPALVPVLEAEPNFEAVHFESPVVREAGGRDRFDIVATLLRTQPEAKQP